MPDFKVLPTVNGDPVSKTEIEVAATDDMITDADLWGYLTGGTLVKTAWSNIKAALQTAFDSVYAAITDVVLRDGSTPLTGDWDIGEDRAIQLEKLQARDGEGITVVDDGGNVAIIVLDGGKVAVGDEVTSSNATRIFNIVGTAGVLRVMRISADIDSASPAVELMHRTSADGSDTAYWDMYVQSDGFKIRDRNNGQVNALFVPADGLGRLIVGDLSSVGASRLGIKAGASSNDAAVGGVLYPTATAVGNIGTGIDTLYTYSVPANTLSANHMSMIFKAYGVVAANANGKTLVVSFGGSTLATIAVGTGVAYKWRIEADIYRISATSIKAATHVWFDNGVGYVAYHATTSPTLSNANTFLLTGNAVNNNDIVMEAGKLYWDDQNT